MKKFLKEFEKFALRGNVMDLAVGVIIGASFQSIVNSLVNDVISPIIGLFAKTDLSYLSFTIRDVEIKYGSFLTAVVNFLIMAFVIFVFVKAINKLQNLGQRKNKKMVAATTKKCPYCQSDISVKAIRCPFCTSDLDE